MLAPKSTTVSSCAQIFSHTSTSKSFKSNRKIEDGRAANSASKLEGGNIDLHYSCSVAAVEAAGQIQGHNPESARFSLT
jgi:hypothetical protein